MKRQGFSSTTLFMLCAALAATGWIDQGAWADGATPCAFTVQDAAPLLGVAPEKVEADVAEQYPGFWMCVFRSGSRTISYSVTVSTSEQEAAAAMEAYRENLELAGNTAPFRDSLEAGAYSDILNLGDDAVWTDINKTLSVRKGKSSIQVQLPAGKSEQLEVARALLARP